MKTADATFTAIDFESAGAQAGRTDVPVQIGMATMHGTTIDADSLFCSYLKSDQPITWSARKVHGIADADVADAPPLATLWPSIRDALSARIVVAHGSGTEKRFLRAFPFHGFGPWVDTLKVAHAAWPDAPGHSLGDLVVMAGLQQEVDNLCPDRRWHDALYDSVASLVLLRHVILHRELLHHHIETLVAPNRASYYFHRAARSEVNGKHE